MIKDFQLVQRLPFITEMCKGKRVLHLGCTNSPYTKEAIDDEMLLHFELEKIASEVYGLDADRDALEVLRSHGTKNLYYADLEHLADLEIDMTFDIIVAGEMIEHLSNPGLFLNGIRRFMNENSRLLITTINAYSGMRFTYYGVRGKRGKAEPVHPDHVAYYSYSTLSLLVKRHDLKIDQFVYYDLGKEHRRHNRWFLNIMNDISVLIAPQWADGVIAVCRL